MSYYLSRTLCDVLEEMRKCNETRNYSYLPGLISEAQSMANKMEAGLGDKSDLVRMKEDWSELKKQIKELQKEKDDLDKALGKEKPKRRGLRDIL